MAKKTMTPSNEMNDRQIEKLVGKVRDAAWKHRRDISKSAAQQALGVDNLGMRMFAVFRDIAQTMTGLVVRVVKVNRARSTLDALKACGRILYVNEQVAATAPRGTAKRQKLKYFVPRPECYVNGWLSPQKLEDEYKFHGLAVDLQAQTDDNAANPEFADGKPNACQWKDKDGNWCFATFYRWLDERRVDVSRNDGDWDDLWSFAGIPQESSGAQT